MRVAAGMLQHLVLKKKIGKANDALIIFVIYYKLNPGVFIVTKTIRNGI
jgi:hypothetical protein